MFEVEIEARRQTLAENLELPWYTLTLPRRASFAYVFVPPFVYDGDRCYALMHPGKHKVYIDATMAARSVPEYWAHETFHLICNVARAGRAELHMEAGPEEDFARLFQKAGIVVLAAHGLKCPRLPRGLAAFRRKCVGQSIEIT